MTSLTLLRYDILVALLNLSKIQKEFLFALLEHKSLPAMFFFFFLTAPQLFFVILMEFHYMHVYYYVVFSHNQGAPKEGSGSLDISLLSGSLFFKLPLPKSLQLLISVFSTQLEHYALLEISLFVLWYRKCLRNNTNVILYLTFPVSFFSGVIDLAC